MPKGVPPRRFFLRFGGRLSPSDELATLIPLQSLCALRHGEHQEIRLCPFRGCLPSVLFLSWPFRPPWPRFWLASRRPRRRRSSASPNFKKRPPHQSIPFLT